MAPDSSTPVYPFPTGIPGFDFIADGGLPAGRATLLAGSSGSGKTVFSAQFLVEGIRQESHPGVFITFEEPPDAIRANVQSLEWPIADWEDQGWWAFVDLSPGESQAEMAGEFDLGALLPRIEHAVNRVGAQRLVIDSLGTLYSQFADRHMVRQALGQLMAAVRRMGITTLVTAERTEEYGPVARFDVEEFVADSVVLLRNPLDGEKRRRTAEILKMRGKSHQKGEFPFTASHASGGLSVVPLSAIELNQPSSTERASFGVPELDAMCAGGVLRSSVSLIAGPTGTGKSLIASHFFTGNPEERNLVFAFEEGADQIRRNGQGLGLPIAEMEEGDQLRIAAAYPETATLEDHLVEMKSRIEAYNPNRVVLDSVSALERIGSPRGFREFLIAFVAYLKEQRVTALFTVNTSNLEGGGMASDAQISSLTDTIILLRYTEAESEIQRGLTVLKMRGSDQDKSVRKFTITSEGIRIGDSFQDQSASFLG